MRKSEIAFSIIPVVRPPCLRRLFRTSAGLFASCCCGDVRLARALPRSVPVGGLALRANTQQACKHVLAVQLVHARDGGGPSPEIVVDAVPKKKTYPQVWPAYNRAQATEKRRVQVLLADLTRHLPDRERPAWRTSRRSRAAAGKPSSRSRATPRGAAAGNSRRRSTSSSSSARSSWRATTSAATSKARSASSSGSSATRCGARATWRLPTKSSVKSGFATP